MTTDTFEEEFPYFSVNVPTSFPSAGATDSLAAKHQSSPNSYLRLGDTPAPADLNGQDEPGLEQRSELTGTPEWPLDLYRSFAPDNNDTVPNGNVLRVNAGESEPFDVDGNFYKNVGWLDHSNGHRVSTTHGDKVEVITGNYKLVVLGREGDAQKSTGFDMSGGHTNSWAQTPGAIRTITSEAGTFKVTSVTDSGHAYNVFEGFDTYHLVGGGSHISVMGGDNDRTEKGGGPADRVVDAAWANKIFDSDFATTVVNIDAGDLSQANPWPSLSETQDLKTNAAAFSVAPKTFEDVTALPKADRVIEARWGPSISDWTSGENVQEQAQAASMNETINATTIDNRVTVENEFLEVWSCGRYLEEFYGNRKNVTIAPTETELHASLNVLDIAFTGFSLDFAVGGLGLDVEAHLLDVGISATAFDIDIACGLGVERSPTAINWVDSTTCKRLVELRKTAVAKFNSGCLLVKNSALKIFA